MSDDLRAYAGEATAEDWDKVPFPAKQQLGFHDEVPNGVRQGRSINDFTGKAPEELLGSADISERQDGHVVLKSEVTYHLDPAPVLSPYTNPADAPAGAGVAVAADRAEESLVGTIPTGSVDKVLAWVGDDKARAQLALEAEQAKPEPRQSLIARLSAL